MEKCFAMLEFVQDISDFSLKVLRIQAQRWRSTFQKNVVKYSEHKCCHTFTHTGFTLFEIHRSTHSLFASFGSPCLISE